jgi:hypothetical protein
MARRAGGFGRDAIEGQGPSAWMRPMSKAKIFKHSELQLKPAVTPFGNLVDHPCDQRRDQPAYGGGIEYLENASIDWTVTYDWTARQGTVEP